MADDDQFEGDEATEVVRPGWSTTTKVLLALLAGGAICVAVCCGGAIWWGNSLKDAVTSDPDRIATIQEKIVGIEVPADLKPVFGMDMNMIFMKMRMAGYNAEGGGPAGAAGNPAPNMQMKGKSLMLMEMEITGQSEAQMEQSMRQQAAQQGSANVVVATSEAKTFTVNGKEISFTFAKGTNPQDNTPVRQVSGSFPGRSGYAMLQFVVPEDQWDEAEATKLIESISK